ncbi:hypothetical protein B0H17DRAFT_1213464 [Mycena rosella]|uniref:Uncharacterized protein n=1 Tax=Mycena rosella TaxID=1033263 RepID=A0AAD7CSF4_MYCRO|nr:hypothetical protein B0H17DRAFT_1213464 [Mycena rosella]
MDMCGIYALLMAFPSYRRIELSINDHIPPGELATVGGDLLDFQVHFPDSEPWRAYSTAIGTDITALDTQWTRIAVPAGSEDDLSFDSYSLIPDTLYMRRSWISEASRLLESGIATGVKLDDLLLIDIPLYTRTNQGTQPRPCTSASATNIPARTRPRPYMRADAKRTPRSRPGPPVYASPPGPRRQAPSSSSAASTRSYTPQYPDENNILPRFAHQQPATRNGDANSPRTPGGTPVHAPPTLPIERRRELAAHHTTDTLRLRPTSPPARASLRPFRE